MDDEALNDELDRLGKPGLEGTVSYMYLDSATPPNVTAGIGFLLASVDAAVALPWQHADGTPATAQEISADFFRVRNMAGGLRAEKYQGNLCLTHNAIYAEGRRRLRAMLSALPGLFPAYESFPAGVQQALLDLEYNLGPGKLSTWTKLRAACNSTPPNWANLLADGHTVDPLCAAAQCRVANPDHRLGREARNDFRSNAFVAAAAAVRG
jgi:GH24 family phage-related lysozyme (muramidase)